MELFSFSDTVKSVVILDIGARIIHDDPPIYDSLIQNTHCEVIAVDADPDACKQQIKSMQDNIFLIKNVVLGDGKPHSFNKCSLPPCSSILEPNRHVLTQYSGMMPFYEVESIEQVNTLTLDSEFRDIFLDLLKIDVQGYELNILQNGKNVLESTSAIHIEVGFIEKYKGQPLFRDIDHFLSEQGFHFHCFTGYGTRTPAGIYANNDPISGVNQWLWSDAVYYHRLDDIEWWLREDRLLRMALVFHYVWQSYDYAAHCLKTYDKANKTEHLSHYILSLNENTTIDLHISTGIDENKILSDFIAQQN
ncbi:FkbM family methyltransferase [Citrobacter sp. Cm046]|uniref:FkbM family methyltransferase n=1 Tax=Citrobacter sp. Cm046 TaxID=2985118 RepID=UPI002578BBC7|nr:FkbM family methyltransferase [Citrobacter sp. Cm046]MDM2928492.1 FkbM family methyltransferase [Citrobacter sp. Cm046]